MKTKNIDTLIDESVSDIINQLLSLITIHDDATKKVEHPAEEFGELFGKVTDEPLTIKVGWKGWREAIPWSRESWFNDFGYFNEAIQSNQITTPENGLELARELNTVVNNVYKHAKENGSESNTLVLVMGLDAEEIESEYGIEFLSMLLRVFRVGKAQAKQDTLYALKRKASKGDLNAQKTILLHEGELSSENAKAASSGSLTIVQDKDDRNL